VIEVFFLAIALSMDALAVSIGLGAKNKTNVLRLALIAGAYFGVFQAVMPLFGYIAGRGVLGWIEEYAPWVAFILLLIVGSKMIYESFVDGVADDIQAVTHRVMLLLAIATSIDAMAAGFALPLLDFDPLLACLLIGLTTMLCSWAGIFIGIRSGTMLESKAEMFGGVVLILIGLKILLP
jgi:putative Mn2+ efflux pump MntP